ncbi:MAG TPA: hypothetical protein VGC67_09165 [Cellulomonas sp.]
MAARWERVAASAEIVALNGEWSGCMAEAGFADLTTVDDAQQELYTGWSTVQGWSDPEYTALAESWDWGARPDGPPAPEPDAAAVADFTAKEIAQAVADLGCQDQIDYSSRALAIDHADQQEFVDQHRDELEAWVEAAAEARSR